MAASTLSRGNLSFPSYPQQRKQTSINTGRFPGLSLYDFPSGFGTDELSTSPDSPTYPAFTNTYQLPTANDWLPWSKDPVLTEAPDFPSVEPDDDTFVRPLDLSPAINPLDLTNAMPDVAALNQDVFDQSSDKFYSTPSPAREDFGLSSQTTTSRTSTDSRHSRKRKSTSSEEYVASPTRSSTSPEPDKNARPSRRRSMAPKKTAHNMVEKRYRTNLNDKIAALRDAVPSLRIAAHRLEHQSSDDGDVEMEHDEEDLGGLAPAHKLNKATILSKATEYITHLERKNRALAKENAALVRRVQGLGGVVGKTVGTRW